MTISSLWYFAMPNITAAQTEATEATFVKSPPVIIHKTKQTAENKPRDFEPNKRPITEIISAQEFLLYQDVADFIDSSPQVTVIVQPEQSDVKKHGEVVMKSLTGSDCDRDGIMDDNASCNAVFYKLWLKYKLNK